jgi:hypothetical protein
MPNRAIFRAPRIYDLGFSFFSFQRASKPTPETLTTGRSQQPLEPAGTQKRPTLEAHTRNITLRLALATETSEEHLVVLVDEVQATIVGNCNKSSAPIHITSKRPKISIPWSSRRWVGVVVPKAVTFLPFLMS